MQDDQTENRRKGNRNLNPFGDENEQKKKPRFNIYWIYGITFLVLIGYNFFRGVTGGGVETDQLKFTEMLRQGDVEKIKTIRNKKIVRVFLRKDAMTRNAEFYKKKSRASEV